MTENVTYGLMRKGLEKSRLLPYYHNEFRKKFLDDPAFRERFEKKEVEVRLDE